ncbi:MAG: hypothetical protein RI907_2523, partial [Pseudomonadota bacterium]
MKNLLSNLLLWQKFAILAALGAVLCAVPTTLYVREAFNAVQTRSVEREGVNLAQQLEQVRRTLFLARADSLSNADRHADLAPTLSKVQALKEAASTYKATVDVTAAVDELQRSLAGMKGKVDSKSRLTASDWRQSAAEVNDLLGAILDKSGLTLDPDIDTYYTMVVAGDVLPQVIENLARTRSGAKAVANGDDSREMAMKNHGYLNFAEVHVDEVVDHVAKVGTVNPGLAAKLTATELVARSKAVIASGMAAFVAGKPEALLAYEKDAGQLMVALEDYTTPAMALLGETLDARVAEKKQATTSLLALLGALVLVALGIGYAIIRSVTHPLQRAMSAANAVKDGDLTQHIDTRGRDEAARLLQAISAMQNGLRDRNERDARTLAETSRIRQALDVAAANVVVASADMQVVYANDASVQMFRNCESDVRKLLPDFQSGQLVGSRLDTLLRTLSGEPGLLDQLQGTRTTRLSVGGSKIDLSLTPIRDAQGQSLGFVSEWKDMTTELARQEQEAIVAAENLRVRQALDCSSTNVMIADPSGNIV